LSAAGAIEPLVDTDVWIDYLRGHPLAVEFVQSLPERVWVSAVSVGELYVGVREGKERKALELLLSTLEVIALGQETASRGGLLRRDWGRSHGIGLNDALIAATAQVNGLCLHTLDVKHYPMLDDAMCRRAYVKV
jgi:predicted nucleic acid-binding protein